MSDQLLVFVSSTMGELQQARLAAERAIRSIELTRSWLFEHTEAMSGPLDETYLRNVRRCDLFVLLLAHDVSSAVVSEVETAVAKNKPILYFLLEEDERQRTDEAQTLREQVVQPEGLVVLDSEGALKAGELERAAAWARLATAKQ